MIIKKRITNQILKLKNNVEKGIKKIQNFIKKQIIRYQKCQEKKKSSDKDDNKTTKQGSSMKQGAYYFCTICHQSLYQHSFRFFKHEKCQTLTLQFCHLVKSFDEKLYICETFLKHH